MAAVINSWLIASAVPVFVIDCVTEKVETKKREKKEKAALDLVLLHCSTFCKAVVEIESLYLDVERRAKSGEGICLTSETFTSQCWNQHVPSRILFRTREQNAAFVTEVTPMYKKPGWLKCWLKCVPHLSPPKQHL